MEKMKEKMADITKMREHIQDMLSEVITMAKGKNDIPCEIPGAMTDMIKDLAEAEEHIANCCKAEKEMEYRKKIMDAMDTADYGKDYDAKGPLMGYRPPIYDYPMGYTVGSSTAPSSTMPVSSGRGQNYDNYREMRRHYTNNQNSESQRKMKESRDSLFDDMESIITETWMDLEPAERNKYMQKGQMLMNKLQTMPV